MVNKFKQQPDTYREFIQEINNSLWVKGSYNYYKVLKQIKKREDVEIVLAEQKLSQQKVVIKSINKQSLKDKNNMQKLKNLINILKTLKGAPNIVEIVEIIEDRKCIHLVMKFAVHGDMVEFIKKRGMLSSDRLKTFMRKIALAIKRVHDSGVIHRDIKLTNILVDAREEPVLADFEIC